MPGTSDVRAPPVAPAQASTPRLASRSLLRAHAPPPSSVAVASSPEALKLKWLSACRRGSYATVQSGIREGWAPVNACDAVGYTALMRCCVSGQMLELLLGCSAVDVNATGAPDGTTPLMLAARYRTARTVEALLHAGARGSRDARGSSELHKAAANPNESVLQLMLTHCHDRVRLLHFDDCRKDANLKPSP